jgi:hypothetical protein
MQTRLVRAPAPGTFGILIISCLVLASVSAIAVLLRNVLDFCVSQL